MVSILFLSHCHQPGGVDMSQPQDSWTSLPALLPPSILPSFPFSSPYWLSLPPKGFHPMILVSCSNTTDFLVPIKERYRSYDFLIKMHLRSSPNRDVGDSQTSFLNVRRHPCTLFPALPSKFPRQFILLWALPACSSCLSSPPHKAVWSNAPQYYHLFRIPIPVLFPR